MLIRWNAVVALSFLLYLITLGNHKFLYVYICLFLVMDTFQTLNSKIPTEVRTNNIVCCIETGIARCLIRIEVEGDKTN